MSDYESRGECPRCFSRKRRGDEHSCQWCDACGHEFVVRPECAEAARDDRLIARYRDALAAAVAPGATRQATLDLQQARARLSWRMRELRERRDNAQHVADIRSGKACEDERAAGNGGCGMCAWCCKHWRERAEIAEMRLAAASKKK